MSKAAMGLAKGWTCPGCGRRREGPYCPACGEERLRPRDLKADDVAARMLGAFSSVDGRLLRSFRALLTAPGTLSESYVAGRRRPYVAPLQLFLIANALFFALQSLTVIEVFASPLASHLHGQDWSELARPLVAARLADTHRSLADFAPIFDRTAVVNAKALIILMALAFAPLLPALFPRAGRSLGAHLVFALHLYTFILLLMCAALLIAGGEALAGGLGLASPRVDLTLSLVMIAAVALYLYLSAGRFYGSRGAPRVAKALSLAAAVGALTLGYRFVIFLITLYTS